jgi:S-(hydroxymethyl)glutathione dehydrogenase/alcohol dehydrogenase
MVEVTMPRTLGVGQLLIRIARSGACASQVHEIDGRKGPDPYLPHMLGHEAVGEVIDIGPGVTRFRPGDFVIAHWRIAPGIQSEPIYLQTSIGEVNAGPVTTFSEFSVISENRLTTLPGSIDLELAPLLGCAMTTGFGAVTREAYVSPGESAVIVGFGGIGISILKALKLVSASPIIVFDISDEKIELAKNLGADFAFNALHLPSSIAETVFEVLDDGADVVFEATGSRSTIEQAFSATSRNGRTVLLGVPDSSNPAQISTLDLHLGKSLIGSHGGSSKPEIDIPRIGKLMETGAFELQDFPTVAYPLKQVNSALDHLRTGVPGRVILTND